MRERVFETDAFEILTTPRRPAPPRVYTGCSANSDVDGSIRAKTTAFEIASKIQSSLVTVWIFVGSGVVESAPNCSEHSYTYLSYLEKKEKKKKKRKRHQETERDSILSCRVSESRRRRSSVARENDERV